MVRRELSGEAKVFLSSPAGDRARDDHGRRTRVRDPADDHGETAL